MRARSVRLVWLVGAMLLLALSRHLLVQPPAVDPDHPFDTVRALESLSRVLTPEEPHPVDTDSADGVVARWLEEIRAAGFAPVVDEAFHCTTRWGAVCARVRNIGFWVGEPGDDAVMLASHHDSVPAGPGAADDGMGVAASLEIARHYKGKAAPRPLYVLITDAEEIGLVGASRFVEASPVAPLIKAVVSMEARGNRGTATMFETSQPNGRDVGALGPNGTLRPLTNSLAADIYRRMPNGTDVTEFFRLGVDATNFSMIGRHPHYHSAQDTVANLDPRSVFHVGASALAAVDGFMDADTNTAASEPSLIYTDLLRRTVLSLPAVLRWPVLGLALALCTVAAWRAPGSLWRAVVGPPLATVAGVGLAVVLGVAVAALRPESAFGTAHPWALRGLFAAASLLGALGMARWLFRANGWASWVAGVWAWVMGLGLAAAWLLPGGSVHFVLPALMVIPAAALLVAAKERAAAWLFAAATVAWLALTQPTVPLAETALFIEGSAPFTLLLVLGFLSALPLMWRKRGGSRPALGLVGIATAGFGAAALLVPAYSPARPQALSFVHLDGDGLDAAQLRLDRDQGDPVPAEIAAVATFAGSPRRAPAAPLPTDGVTLTALGEGQYRVESPAADRLTLALEDSSGEARITAVGGFAFGESAPAAVRCDGRSCRNMVVDLGDGGAALLVQEVRYGLGPSGAAIEAARPPRATARHSGDRRVVRHRFALEPLQ